MDKLMVLFGNLSGEMKTTGVPLATGVDIEAFKKEDDDFYEVVVEIPAGPSTRGWNYTKFALQSIVDKVMRNTLAGFLGHQRPENVKNEFKTPVTHWVGAKMEGESAFFRGVIDKSSPDLKRWLRTGRIKQVSIFGHPKLQTSNGETQVIDYDALSIDWTPLDRAGMPTKIVATSGEMWDMDGMGPDNKNINGGAKTLNPEELLKELGKMMKNKQITVPMIAGEIGLSVDQVAGEMDSAWLETKTNAEKQLKDVSKALGISGEMNVVEVAKKAAKAIEEKENADFNKLVGEMMDEKVKSDVIKKDIRNPETQIGKFYAYHTQGLTPGMEKDKISGELDNFLADKVIKGIIDTYHTDQPAGLGVTNTNTNTSSGLKTKRTAL
ncbi:hypothetical protein GLV94_05280 [Virgibacillus halodenitrificans]|uniref:hypothetical protein n=1 Tax=Virgibacillus halodenitrificans TaxID=1482 RepID=UPI00136E0FF1|nr:hypothetical protein [Virgibacillus halodenitrificans]MYL45047.1 hypothetical protein [Virgibacillus halodenitrificans]